MPTTLLLPLPDFWTFHRLSQVDNNDDQIVTFIRYSSSHDYHRSFEILHEKFGNTKRLIFFDHVGFGFSDKPLNDYEFTLHDHAENALKLFEVLDVKSAHIVAHDMVNMFNADII